MEIYTLQDLMLHAENYTYTLIIVFLLSIVAFWLFLTDREDMDEKYPDLPKHHA